MIDFSQVRGLTIPEGEVAMISRGSKVLWRKKKYKCEVEYLEATGEQWFDLKFKPGINTRFELMTQILETTASTTSKGVIGVAYTPDYRYAIGFYNGKLRFQWGSGAAAVEKNYHDPNYAQFRNPTLYVCSKDGFYINGVLEWTPQTENIAADQPCYIFRNNTANFYAGVNQRIYYFKDYDGSTLVRDLIPVIDWNDRPCMYDRVTDELFYNQGAGEFIAGRQIHPVEWLASTGTQCIDAGVNADSKLGFNITYKMDSQGDSETRWGAIGQNGSTYVRHHTSRDTASGALSYFLAGAKAFALTNDMNEHTLLLDAEAGVYAYDGVSAAFKKVAFDCQLNFWLFGRNSNAASLVNYAKMTIEKCQLHSNGVLVRDYTPAHDENGVGFLFDRVTHTIFDNAGTGEFLYGGEVA